jgi:hypothetical protein
MTVIPAPSSELLWLTLAYALLAFLLLILCLATRWSWRLKAALVVLVSSFYLFHSQVLRSVAGWPADDALPARFVLLSAVFDEPSPARGHAGAIYIWVNELREQQALSLPRVHRLPYDKDLQRILGEGLKKAKDGNTQIGSAEPRRGQGGLPWLRPASEDKVQIKLSDLPRAQLPEK